MRNINAVRQLLAAYGMDISGLDEDLTGMLLPHYCTSKNQRIANLQPHYTNDLHKTAQTVFLLAGYTLKDGYGPHVEGADYAYSDRIFQWNWDKAEATWKQAREAFPDAMDTAACREAWLRLYWDKPRLELVHIMAGFNLSNGYPYQVYGYIQEPKDATP